jgi:superfamily II DNA or RNA helicase
MSHRRDESANLASLQPLRPYQKCALSIVQSFLSSCSLLDSSKNNRIRQPLSAPTTSLPLRCTEEGVEQAKNGTSQSALLYLPTGGGKTRIAAALTLWTRNRGGRTLFIVNRLQLAIQAKQAFLREGINEDEIGIIEKGSKLGFDKPVIIATIQSLSSRRRRRIKHKHQLVISSERVAKQEDNDNDENETDDKDETVEDHETEDNDREKEDERSLVAETEHDEEEEEEDYPIADFVVIDEAHGAVSNSFAPLVDFYLSSKGASKVEWLDEKEKSFNRTFILGMTATPTRLQGEEKLEKVFQRLIRGPSVSQLVRDGVLVPPIPIRAAHESTKNASKSLLLRASKDRQLMNTMHPFNDEDEDNDDIINGGISVKKKTADDLCLQMTLEEQKVLNHVVQTWKHFCYQKAIKSVDVDNDKFAIDENSSKKDGLESTALPSSTKTTKTLTSTRRSIVFASSVKHSQAIVAAFLAHDILACHVDGNTSASDRERVYENMRQGKIDVLSSVGVICEGYDEPSVSCVVLLRPTASRGLYVQQVGRGLRSYQGKKDCLVLDFVDNSLRHGPVTVPITCSLDNTVSSSPRYENNNYNEAWVCSDPLCCAISHAAETNCQYCNLPRYGRSSSSSSSSSTSIPKSSSSIVSGKSMLPTRIAQTKSPYEQGFESISLSVSDFVPPSPPKPQPKDKSNQEDVDSLVSAISTLALGGEGVNKIGVLERYSSSSSGSLGGGTNDKNNKSSMMTHSGKSTNSDTTRPVGIPIRRPFHSNAEVAQSRYPNSKNSGAPPIRPPLSSSMAADTAKVAPAVLSSSLSNHSTNSNTNLGNSSSITQPYKLFSSGSGPSHGATPEIFTYSAFQSACHRLSLTMGEKNLLDDFSFMYIDRDWTKQKNGDGTRWIHAPSGVTDFDASFLLSIAAQITPYVDHEWKTRGREQSKGLSEKQLGHLQGILRKVRAYHHRQLHNRQQSSIPDTSSTSASGEAPAPAVAVVKEEEEASSST